MSSRMERMSRAAVTAMPKAAERVIEAAEESLAVAKSARAQIRRQRMNSQGQLPAVAVEKPPETEKLEMPAEWREDEITRKITLPEKQ